MWVFKLILRNTGRHKLRTMLTVLGLAMAVIAFGVIRTLISSFYYGAEILPPDRLITRNAVSFIMDLPMSYKGKIESVPGVLSVAYGNWFGGLYNNDPKNFFPNFAVGPDNYLDIYSEMVIPPDQKEQYLKEKNSAAAGQQLANRFGWKIGDVIRLTGQIYPGEWEFVLRAIYKGNQPGVDESSLFFRYDYFDDHLRETTPEMAGGVGWYIVKIDSPARSAQIGVAIDALFKNSTAETLTETEKLFTLNFLEQMSVIIKGMRILSYLIIGIIFLVLANTMAMSARERISEYALLKTLGFRPYHLTGLVLGESLVIAALGGLTGLILTFPIIAAVGKFIKNYFNVMDVNSLTIILAIVFVAIVGVLAAIFPIYRAVKISIIDGLRNIG